MRMIAKLALASVSLCAISAPAFAQDTGIQAAEEESDVIIVTARRQDESLQDVPLTVNAVTAESIEKLNLREFTEITNLVPGLQLQENANGIGTTSVIRGVKYDVNASGNNGTIEFYRNDAPISSGALFTSMYDIGQIEVLRGPQGTLRGRASPSGSITITTRKPDLTEPGGYMQGTVNDIGGWNINGAMNIPLVEDKLAVRIAGLVTENEANRVRSLRLPDVKPDGSSEALRVSVSADPLDGVLLLDGTYEKVKAERNSFDQLASASLSIPGAGPSPVQIRDKDRLSYMNTLSLSDNTFRIFTWKARLNLFGQSLSYTGGDLKQLLNSFNPSDDGAVFTSSTIPGSSLAARAFPGTRTDQYGRVSETHGNGTSHEILLQNDERIAGLFDYVVGYFQYNNDTITYLNSQTIVPNATATGVGALVNDTALQRLGDSTEKSFFGNLTVHPIEGMEISGGLRRIKFHKTGSLFIPAFNATSFPEDDKYKKTIYAASVKYRVNQDLMVYLSTGSSWRPGAIAIGGPTFGTSALQDSFLRTGPETSKSYEFGVKSDWLDRRLTLNLTLYDQKFKNYPFRVPGASGNSGIFAIDNSNVRRGGAPQVTPFNYISAVPVTVKGVEVEMNFQATDNWSIGGVVSYSDGKIKNGTLPCLDLNGDGIPDEALSPPTLAQLQAATGTNNISACTVTQRASQEAPFGFTLQTEYNLPLSSSLDGYVRGLLSYKGTSLADPQNSFDDVSSHGILNLYAGIRHPDGNWDLTVFAKNLLDTYRRTTGDTTNVLSTATAVGRLSSTNMIGLASIAPREFGLSLRIAVGSR